jgi:protoheme IX farnesyltransferase
MAADCILVITATQPRLAPLPGRLNAAAVLWFGIAVSAIGCIYLATAVNVLARLLALLTLLPYLFLYTPLKRKTAMCVLVGVLPGGVPRLIGWAAASGKLSCEAWALYAMVLAWQFPHFMAIAWICREDYDRAGYRLVPPAHTRVSFVTLQTILPLQALSPISLFAVSGGQPSILSGIGALLLSVGFLYHGAQFVRRRSSSAARRLLLASIIYLPSLSVLAVLLRAWRVL